MEKIHSLLIAIDSIHMHFRKFIFSVLLLFLCSLVLLFTLMVYHVQNLVYETCDRVLANGVESTGVIQIIEDDFYNSDSILQYMKELKGQKEIHAVGDCVECLETGKSLDSLLKIQKEYYKEKEENEGEMELHIWEIMSSTLPLCRLELSAGVLPEQLDFDSDDKYYLYLGSAFKEIPIGTTYEGADGIYEVAGILASGQEWIKEDLLMDFSYENGNAAQICDYMVFKMKEERLPMTDYLWISASEGCSIYDVMETADSLAQKRNLEIHYSSLQERYEISKTSTISLLGYLHQIIWILGITSLFILISLQIVFILENRREYGILFSLGFSQKEVSMSVLYYNSITSIVAVLLVLPCLYAIADHWFVSCGMDYLIKYVFLPYLLPAQGFLIGIMLLAVTVVANVILYILTPVQMLRSE